MKDLLFILSLVFNTAVMYSQELIHDCFGPDVGINDSGKLKSVQQFIHENLIYPDSATYYRVEGKVYIGFSLDSLGNITKVQLYRDIGAGCGEEAMRVINLTNGKWCYSSCFKKRKEYTFMIPIVFIFTESDNKKQITPAANEN